MLKVGQLFERRKTLPKPAIIFNFRGSGNISPPTTSATTPMKSTDRKEVHGAAIPKILFFAR